MNRGARFDDTEQYRYLLWREWDPTLPRLGFVMLNPNRADAVVDDPTIRRCIGFARSWQYGAVEVGNLFAYRTPHPKHLKQVDDPVGNENDEYLALMLSRVDRVVLAWGNWGLIQGRDQVVLPLFKSHPHVYCFGLTKTGQPRHPLYLKRETQCFSWLAA